MTLGSLGEGLGFLLSHPGRTSPLVPSGPQITKSLLMCSSKSTWPQERAGLRGDGSSEAGSRAELINRTERALWGHRGGPSRLDWKACWEVQGRCGEHGVGRGVLCAQQGGWHLAEGTVTRRWLEAAVSSGDDLMMVLGGDVETGCSAPISLQMALLHLLG